MKLCSILAVLLVTAAPVAFGQALPTAEASPISTGFELPVTAGTLQYGVSASESLNWGYYAGSGVTPATNVTGDLAFISSSKRDPTSMVLAGGYSWSTGPAYGFMSLGVSQTINLKRWGFLLSDGLSYLPGTATTGLTGVPGVGDQGLPPVQVGPDTGQGILTEYSNRIGNSTSLSLQRPITGKTSFNAAGSYMINRFLTTSGGNTSSNSGLDTDAENGGGGISHQFSERNTLAGNYSYGAFTYPASNSAPSVPNFRNQSASLQFIHKFTRKLGMSASAGPQWTDVEMAGASWSLSAYADAALSYAGKLTRSSLTYVRGTNYGFGVAGGSISDSVSFSTSRTFVRVWNCAFTAGYTRSSNLTGEAPFTFYTTLAGVQVSRAIGRSISTFASYTLENQSSQNPTAAAVDAFSGFSQVAGFGLTYSPMAIHIGHQ